MHIDLQFVLIVAGALVSAVVPVIVRRAGIDETIVGKMLLAICNDVAGAVSATKRPPSGPDTGPGYEIKPPERRQSSSSMLVALAAAALTVTGCGGSLLSTVVTTTEYIQAGLIVAKAAADSVFAQKPNPPLQAEVDDLIAELSGEASDWMRLAEGHDVVGGGDVGDAWVRLVKSRNDLVAILKQAGVATTALGAGGTVDVYVSGPLKNRTVLDLAEMRGKR